MTCARAGKGGWHAPQDARTIDTPFPRLVRKFEEFCLQAFFPDAEGREKRGEGGRR